MPLFSSHEIESRLPVLGSNWLLYSSSKSVPHCLISVGWVAAACQTNYLNILRQGIAGNDMICSYIPKCLTDSYQSSEFIQFTPIHSGIMVASRFWPYFWKYFFDSKTPNGTKDYINLWNLKAHPCIEFARGSTKPPLKYGHGWVITFKITPFAWSLMRVLASVNLC